MESKIPPQYASEAVRKPKGMKKKQIPAAKPQCGVWICIVLSKWKTPTDKFYKHWNPWGLGKVKCAPEPQGTHKVVYFILVETTQLKKSS